MEKYIAGVAGVTVIPIATLLARHFITKFITRFSAFRLIIDGTGVHFELTVKPETKSAEPKLLND